MAKDANAFDANFAEVRRRYLSGLPQRLADLELALASVLVAGAGPNDEAGLPQVRHIAHKLAGSGASFGFRPIGDAARRLEKACIAAYAGGTPGTQDWRTIEGLTADVKREIESAGDASPAGLEMAGPRGPRSAPRSKSVLLVEDDSDQAEQTKIGLSRFGYDAVIVADAADLAGAVTRCAPAVIVLDLEIGGERTAGTDAVRHLRSTSGIDCPVIATTAHGDFEARLAAVRAGCDAFLTKPVAVTDLVQILDSLTDEVADEPQRVLVIDDDPDMVRYVPIVLQSAGMISEGISDPARALEKLDEFSPELILIDLWMPQCSGKEVAAIIRQQSKYASIPIVFLSGETDTDLQMEAMDEGGDYFLTKPIDPKYLISAVRSRVERFRALRDQMVRDSMTGLFNHTVTKQMLETALERSRRTDSVLSFAMLDIDRFKSVNDTHGHGVGDVVIKILASILKRRLRGADVIGRLGGEEFGVVLPDTAGHNAVEVMESIRSTFAETKHRADSTEFQVTLSCGIAEFPALDSGPELSERADHALFEAKSGGRNRVVLATAQGSQTLAAAR